MQSILISQGRARSRNQARTKRIKLFGRSVCLEGDDHQHIGGGGSHRRTRRIAKHRCTLRFFLLEFLCLFFVFVFLFNPLKRASLFYYTTVSMRSSRPSKRASTMGLEFFFFTFVDHKPTGSGDLTFSLFSPMRGDDGKRNEQKGNGFGKKNYFVYYYILLHGIVCCALIFMCSEQREAHLIASPR